MNLPFKKLGNGFELPLLSMGTWMIGGALEPDPQCDIHAEIMGIRKGLDLGITCIDTAEMYADGFTEKIVGRAIHGYDRGSLQIISKVSPHHLSYEALLRANEATLKRLQTNYLDVYLIHKPNPEIPLAETMRGMRTLLDQGVVRHIGVSNFNTQTLRKAQDLLGAPIVLDQVHYNLVFREPEKTGLLEYCRENDLFLMAWRPLQKGAIAADPPAILREISAKYGKSPNQVAINWLIAQKNVVTLSTMRQAKHITENLGAVGWSLDAEEVERLRQRFPDQQNVSDREPLR